MHCTKLDGSLKVIKMTRLPIILARFGCIVLGLALWFGTQALLAGRAFPENSIGDGLFDLTVGIHARLEANPALANALLVASSAVIDIIGIFLLGSAVFGRTIRPFLGLLILFFLRQVCQGLCALPAPIGMIWRDPGFPALLVTYGTASDLFFSGHTGLAVFGATELARRPGMMWKIVGVLIAVFEATTVIVLRAHYTMDVFTGIVVALLVATFVDRLALPIDDLLERKLSRQNAA